jgi:hypothetical protein
MHTQFDIDRITSRPNLDSFANECLRHGIIVTVAVGTFPTTTGAADAQSAATKSAGVGQENVIVTLPSYAATF